MKRSGGRSSKNDSSREVHVWDRPVSTHRDRAVSHSHSNAPLPNSHDKADHLLFTGHVTLHRLVSTQPFCAIASTITRPSSADRVVSPAVVCLIGERRPSPIDLLAQLRGESNAVKDLFWKGRVQICSVD